MKDLKVIAPDEPQLVTINNKKVIYFADPGWEAHSESIEDEFYLMAGRKLKDAGLDFTRIKYTENPPFDEIYDILFFDWGGMSMGNSMLERFCRYIIEDSEKYPNRMFVMVSTFTAAAMQDAMRNGGFDSQENIFLVVSDFIEYFKKYHL